MFITGFILIAIPIATLTIWVNWSMKPVSERVKEKVFVIKRGEGALSFSRRLEDEGIIKNAFIFRIYLGLSGLDKKIQAGSFKLSGQNSAEEIAQSLTKGRIDKWVTIIEGLRKEQTAEILVEDFDIDEKKFLSQVREGELFPDTYLIPTNANEAKILAIFRKNFETKVNAALLETAKKRRLTKDQVLILASIVEREGRNESERPTIAGILIKRWREGMTLGADATVQYALGYSSEEKTWWRKNLTADDLQVNSSYNTRKKVGLPPTAICSPGLSSIRAVVEPRETPYYYYLHDKEGRAHYSETFKEHQQKISQFLL